MNIIAARLDTVTFQSGSILSRFNPLRFHFGSRIFSDLDPCRLQTTVPEFIDPVFAKTSPKRSFSLNRKRAFWLVFAKTGSIISGTGNDLGRVGWVSIKHSFEGNFKAQDFDSSVFCYAIHRNKAKYSFVELLEQKTTTSQNIYSIFDIFIW
jgi:hypothetical protein